jgi:alpha-beta hydrolase superfamily lysophospholipase
MKFVKLVVAAVVGACVALVIAGVLVLNNRPDLSVWHTVDLDEEFSVDSDVQSFTDYLALEDRLFKQLDSQVVSKVPSGPAQIVNRFSRGSLADPEQADVNWNRTFEMLHVDPAAGVLLLHGLTDSPYSLRALGQSMHEAGANVLGLRIPGHGTAPAALASIRWEDMAAAVRLAARHVKQGAGDKPLYLVGYSNGGALAVEYVLAALQDKTLPRVDGVILLSPEIGVMGTARYAVWQGRLGYLLGLHKLAWVSVKPEYDPYKYGSFAVNAGDLAYQVTRHLQERITALRDAGNLADLPPILAFQSAADATVTASALIENLFVRLPAAGHELVLFDINRMVEVDYLLNKDPRDTFLPLLRDSSRNYRLTVVTNGLDETGRVAAYAVPLGTIEPESAQFLNDWPKNIYSLSHVSLPFPPDDPLYGGPDSVSEGKLHLGNLALRGEHKVLHVAAADIMRLRWNPFFDYVEQRVLGFMAPAGGETGQTRAAD